MASILAELPIEVEKSTLARLYPDTRRGYQEKFNGEYRTICKDSNGIHDYNRNGEAGKGLPSDLVAALKKHPLHQFVIAGELVGNQRLHLFDALILGNETIAGGTYEYREAQYHAQFDGFDKLILPVYTARTKEAKVALVERLMQDGAEGVIVRDMLAPYVEGESGQHKKVKFWKTLEAIVMGPSKNHKNSVRLGCYDNAGVLREICGASTIGKPVVVIGDIVEVKYNKGTRNLHIMEISIQRVRTDKRPDRCTLSQIVVNKDFRQ